MTLGNIRANGVRRLDVSCWECHHKAVLDVDGYGDDVPVPSFGPRLVCTILRGHWRRCPAELGGPGGAYGARLDGRLAFFAFREYIAKVPIERVWKRAVFRRR